MPSEVEEVLKRLYDKTWELLEEHQDAVLAVAAALEEHKTISGDEIETAIGLPAGHLAHGHESWTSIDPQRARLAASARAAEKGVSGDPLPNGEHPHPVEVSELQDVADPDDESH